MTEVMKTSVWQTHLWLFSLNRFVDAAANTGGPGFWVTTVTAPTTTRGIELGGGGGEGGGEGKRGGVSGNNTRTITHIVLVALTGLHVCTLAGI